MLRVVITGKDSYIGNHVAAWLTKREEDYEVEVLDVIGDGWKEYDFTGVDAVVHVAGIVHRKDCKDWLLYKSVNADLAVDVAKKAKAEGVRQFVFLSTMAVYGKGKRLRQNCIGKDTVEEPKDFYGKSKLLAERGLSALAGEDFFVSVIRPPNVYGKDCKGGYISGFAKIVKKLPIIPVAYTKVCQSMLYIDNLTELIRLMIEEPKTETVMPQDENAVTAAALMQVMATVLKGRTKCSKFLGLGVRLLAFLPIVKKAYGGVAYDERLSDVYEKKYQVVDFKNAIERTFFR